MDPDLLNKLAGDVLDISSALRVVDLADHESHFSRHVVIFLEVGFEDSFSFVDTAATLDDLVTFSFLHPGGNHLFLVDDQPLGAQDVGFDLS